jgi:hypothetical protein
MCHDNSFDFWGTIGSPVLFTIIATVLAIGASRLILYQQTLATAVSTTFELSAITVKADFLEAATGCRSIHSRIRGLGMALAMQGHIGAATKLSAICGRMEDSIGAILIANKQHFKGRQTNDAEMARIEGEIHAVYSKSGAEFTQITTPIKAYFMIRQLATKG